MPEPYDLLFVGGEVIDVGGGHTGRLNVAVAETVGENGVEPLRRGIAVGDACGIPVMVHIGTAPPALDEVFALLRPGDIGTHCASGIAVPLGPAGAGRL